VIDYSAVYRCTNNKLRYDEHEIERYDITVTTMERILPKSD